jgi:riboflavin kinase/FMN adenylyltransferase
MLKVLMQPENEFAKGCVVTVGNFDGVHHGHKTLITKLKQESEARQLPLAILLFEPQPAEFLRKENPPARLMTWIEKIEALQELFQDNIQPAYVLTLHFNAELAAISADEFVHQVLLHELNVKHIIVGKDFHFGHERAGNLETLCQSGKEHNHDFSVDIFDDVILNETRVSSTVIREAISTNDLKLAEKFLGHPYCIQGEVIKGAQRGRTLGFPTANIALDRLVTAVRGVYAVRIYSLDKKPFKGVANVGSRPTVDGKNHFLEVNIFDFDQEIYGRTIQIEFVEWIRAEKKFDSVDDLKNAIQNDVNNAKVILGEST